ncbi:hypothetical protein [Tenacibaculum finnmarkense]|uniref:hypothetical protein n=1 Tax=Tenacibaculum finnmarkense TaxID=2781243 RepID=UPI00187B4AD0|nr:hypothetical protein [Tenacibaculum finnmarkense]MBE7659468.1 hypothetical protein [Tenacibaculum finnmarkense genomovar finnmarkense]MCG8250969.1 hypothetical protein [Tenacibaculum finnmarkense genomovar finnmarkense]MCG8814770.1 hypothetical protein [Tenacibaculum finnmarkense]MCG8819788.1 hypothetical protein [Tenacibaculum finnmarkense]
MIKINRLRAEILSNEKNSHKEIYGFDYQFNIGLNIVAGHNSKGKTTINSCIYYALGMEELLGGHNEKALDKALKDEFTIKSEKAEDINHKIIRSRVILEIENNGVIAILTRNIKAGEEKLKPNLINVKISEESTISENYFVNGTGNNESENGFYVWLANFCNINRPTVSNTSKVNDYSPLYLQIIFSTMFIEQTKGWSDFFATMPFFGIPSAKQKNVEFLLNLNELELSTKKDVLSKEEKKLSEKWIKTIKSFDIISKQFNGSFNELPNNLTVDRSKIDDIHILFSVSETEKISLDKYLKSQKNTFNTLKNKPISKIGKNKKELLVKYQEKEKEYFKLKEYIKDFAGKLAIENIQLSNLKKQFQRITKEILDQNNLKKVFSKNILNKKGNHCPTCSQTVSTDLLSNTDIEIPILSIEETIAFLKGQKKMIETSSKSLEVSTSEKKLLLQYFKENLRQKESLIKSLSRDLIADDRTFSEAEILKKLQLEKEIENLLFLELKITELKNELIDLLNKYINNKNAYENLNDSEIEDENKLINFEKKYKNLLYKFGYDSNSDQWKISINRKEPFKYFPVYRAYKSEIPQSIRINSSASDFVRNIWAYTLSLLEVGSNHPGLVIFDEPGQHRTNISSLKSLFKESSEIKNKQIIIFTSIDKEINDKEKLEIKILTEDLNSENYHLIELDKTNKVIQKLTK